MSFLTLPLCPLMIIISSPNDHPINHQFPKQSHFLFCLTASDFSVWDYFSFCFVVKLVLQSPLLPKNCIFHCFPCSGPLGPLTNDRPKCVPLAPRLTQAASKFPPQLPIKLFFHPANFPGEMSGKYFIGNFQNRNRFMV